MFTREHFESIANALAVARNSDSAPATAAAYGSETESIVHAELGILIDKLADRFADIFAESNEHFSRKAFIGACNAASRSQIRRLVAQSNNKNTFNKEQRRKRSKIVQGAVDKIFE